MSNSRPIKFRAWDTKSKEMYSAAEMGRDELTLNPDGRGFVNVDGVSTKLSLYYSHLIPMQFTGLKDKNGKEIYEGDIVTTKNKGIFVIVFDSGAFRLQDIPTELWHCLCDKYKIHDLQIEVIGNQAENPELIK